METIPCPGCRTPLGPEMTSCPICLRPRSKYEITRAYARLREDQARRKRLPLVVAGWSLAAAALGYGLWSFRGPILDAARAARAKASRIAEQSMDARNLVKKRPGAPAPEPAAEPDAPPAPPETAAPPPRALPVAPTAPVAPSIDPNRPAVMPAADPVDTGPVRLSDFNIPPVDADSAWIVYGRVYDVITLKPVAGALLSFQGNEGMMVGSASTDRSGRYFAILPRLQDGGVTVATSDHRFAPIALAEPDIPYKTLSLEERKALAHSVQDGDFHPSPLTDPAGERSYRLSVFLAPAR